MKKSIFYHSPFHELSISEIRKLRSEKVKLGNQAISRHEYLYLEEIKSEIAELDEVIKNKKQQAAKKTA